MGFYNKYILPKIINAGCGTKPIRKQREKRITGRTEKSNVVVRVYILMFQFW